MQCFTATDIGLLRDENQDRVQAEQFGERWLAVVCDGMGGARSGSQASEIAIRELFDRFRHGCKPEMDVDDVRAVLLASVSAANSVIYTTSRMDYRCYGMGTTCVAAFVEREWISIANVGDSRAYLIENGTIRLLTKDHTVVNMLLQQGKITRDQIATHPKRHMLTRAVGVERIVRPDFYRIPRRDDCILLLCSDGLSGVCSPNEILAAVQGNETQAIPQALVGLALEKGGRDNISLAIITP